MAWCFRGASEGLQVGFGTGKQLHHGLGSGGWAPVVASIQAQRVVQAAPKVRKASSSVELSMAVAGLDKNLHKL
jgi:hypothetical protein